MVLSRGLLKLIFGNAKYFPKLILVMAASGGNVWHQLWRLLVKVSANVYNQSW